MAIILITHDLGVVAGMCDEVIVMYAGHLVERGKADDIFYEPAHEYTKGLMRSLPRMEDDGSEKLVPISGTPVDMLAVPPGCPFSPRCASAMQICLTQRPEECAINDPHRHISACWLNVRNAREIIDVPGQMPIIKLGGKA